MMHHILVLASFALLVRFNLQAQSSNVFNNTQCGQYGFRCLSSKTFQFCTQSYGGHIREESIELHSCRDGTVCSEENPAYCSPFYQTSTANYDEVESYLDQVRKIRQKFPKSDYENMNIEFGYDHSTSRAPLKLITTPMPTETTPLTTILPPPFDCDRYGFFADTKNHSLFWFCDVPEHGQGFLLRHMQCEANKYFDPFAKECSIIQRNPRTQRNGEVFLKKNNSPLETRLGNHKFSCKGKMPGKYVDSSDNQRYFICLQSNLSPVAQMALRCPRGTTFDECSGKCLPSLKQNM